MAAAVSGALYGLLHGLGPDHCLALAALLVGERRRWGGLRISLRFGLWHALTLSGLALAAVASGYLVPSSWEQAAELLGGVVLFLLGAFSLRRANGQALVHRHAHAHGQQEGDHLHWHLHRGPGQVEHSHPHTAAAVSGALALSGVRALVLALPPMALAGRSWAGGGAFVLAFGAGVTASMVALGVVFEAARRRGERSGPALWRGVERAVGWSAMALGAFWVCSHAG